MKVSTKLKEVRANQGGFTLIELLVVIGILAILLAITLIAINPNKHFQDTRNAQRSSNVSAILNAVYEYEAANNGNVPASLAAVGTTPVPVAELVAGTPITPSGTTFSTPNLTFTVTGNTITTGSVTVTGCSETADNGTWPVVSGDATTLVVTNANASNTTATGCSVVVVGANVCTDLTPAFLADLPMDPSAAAPTGGSTPCNASTTAYNTGYTIVRSTAGDRFTVSAPDAEGGADISVTR